MCTPFSSSQNIPGDSKRNSLMNDLYEDIESILTRKQLRFEGNFILNISLFQLSMFSDNSYILLWFNNIIYNAGSQTFPTTFRESFQFRKNHYQKKNSFQLVAYHYYRQIQKSFSMYKTWKALKETFTWSKQWQCEFRLRPI